MSSNVHKFLFFAQAFSEALWDNSFPLFFPTLPYLNRLCISKDKNMQHVHVWVFLEYVGLGMVLEVTMVPPVGRGTLGRYRELIHAKAQLL